MVAQATLLLFGSFFVMLLAGVPISAGIGIASIFTALFSMDPAIFALTAAQRCFSGIDSFSLLALPFFSLGGNIMNKGGIAKRLVRLARLAVGKMPGYLAATNVLANMFFGAVSGSSVAATSAMGSIMAPLELDEGYDPNYSAAVNICSAPTGILIPPSGPLILYSITAGGVSVAALFMGGYLPGILMGLCVAVLAVFIAVKKGYKSSAVKDPDPAVKIIIDAVPSLLAVIIVMGGILAGFFTATEAGVVLCLYCGLLSILYKEMTFKSFYNLLADTMESSATILFLIAASSIMSYVMSYSGIPAAISNALMSVSSNRYVILLIMNVFLLVMGMFLDLTPGCLDLHPHLPAHHPQHRHERCAVRHHAHHEPGHRLGHPAGRFLPVRGLRCRQGQDRRRYQVYRAAVRRHGRGTVPCHLHPCHCAVRPVPVRSGAQPWLDVLSPDCSG